MFIYDEDEGTYENLDPWIEPTPLDYEYADEWTDEDAGNAFVALTMDE